METSYLLFIIKSAFFDFSRNKVRTFLTSLGILIGVFSVVLLVALGLGLKKYIAQQFESLGSNLIYIMPGNVISEGGFSGTAPVGTEFDNKDVTSLHRVKNVTDVLPFVVKFVKAEAEGNSKRVELAGTIAEAIPSMNMEIEYGEPFTKADVERGSKKVVMGPKIAEKLFTKAEESIGRTVQLGGQSFVVSGVTKSKGGGGLGGSSIDDHVFAPYTSLYSFNTNKKFWAIYLTASSQDALGQIKQDAKKLLLKRYKEDDFSVIEQAEFLKAINSIFNIVNSVLVAIAAISLLVGGIGIMNIMYVSVTERIKEIGIRRAIGARKFDILSQFLSESVILSLFGGLAGLLLAFLVVLGLQKLFPAYIDISSVLIALGVSSLIGIVFGVFPAKKAADLSPIDAIRYE